MLNITKWNLKCFIIMTAIVFLNMLIVFKKRFWPGVTYAYNANCSKIFLLSMYTLWSMRLYGPNHIAPQNVTFFNLHKASQDVARIIFAFISVAPWEFGAVRYVNGTKREIELTILVFSFYSKKRRKKEKTKEKVVIYNCQPLDNKTYSLFFIC